MPKRSSSQKDTQQLARSVLDAIVPDSDRPAGGTAAAVSGLYFAAADSLAAGKITTSHALHWLKTGTDQILAGQPEAIIAAWAKWREGVSNDISVMMAKGQILAREDYADALRTVAAQVKELPPLKNQAAVALGRLGGLKGGNARAAKLSAARKKAIAKKGADARWKRQREIEKTDNGQG